LIFGSIQFSSCLKNKASFKSGKKWPETKHIHFSVEVKPESLIHTIWYLKKWFSVFSTFWVEEKKVVFFSARRDESLPTRPSADTSKPFRVSLSHFPFVCDLLRGFSIGEPGASPSRKSWKWKEKEREGKGGYKTA